MVYGEVLPGREVYDARSGAGVGRDLQSKASGQRGDGSGLCDAQKPRRPAGASEGSQGDFGQADHASREDGGRGDQKDLYVPQSVRIQGGAGLHKPRAAASGGQSVYGEVACHPGPVHSGGSECVRGDPCHGNSLVSGGDQGDRGRGKAQPGSSG